MEKTMSHEETLLLRSINSINSFLANGCVDVAELHAVAAPAPPCGCSGIFKGNRLVVDWCLALQGGASLKPTLADVCSAS